jgi:hypothetical protein
MATHLLADHPEITGGSFKTNGCPHDRSNRQPALLSVHCKTCLDSPMEKLNNVTGYKAASSYFFLFPNSALWTVKTILGGPPVLQARG